MSQCRTMVSLWLVLLSWLIGKCYPLGTDTIMNIGEHQFNPSVVHYNGVYFATSRTAYMRSRARTWWWINAAYLCQGSDPSFTTSTCYDYNPFEKNFPECKWGTTKKRASVDTTGVEDPKLFIWPGRGLYAVVGRKPRRGVDDIYCPETVIFHQFLAQLLKDPQAKDDRWDLKSPVPLVALDTFPEMYTNRRNVKEKNWMPFVHQDDLYVIHSVLPHRVLKLDPSGIAVEKYVTENLSVLSALKEYDIHGGPPAVLMKKELTGLPYDYYLGILHYFIEYYDSRKTGVGKKKKVYHHYAYKFIANAPFPICGLSSELLLKTRPPVKDMSKENLRIWKDTTGTAYISGLFVSDDGVVWMSYGSSDTDARLLSITVSELESLFTSLHDCRPTLAEGTYIVDDLGDVQRAQNQTMVKVG